MCTDEDGQSVYFQPHGYLPVPIDLDRLSREESLAAIRNYFRDRADDDIKRGFLNLIPTKAAIAAAQAQSAQTDRRSEVERMEAFSKSLQEIRLRYIQEKYGITAHVWYGDCAPPWARTRSS